MKQSTSRKFHAVVAGAALLLCSPFALGASDRDAQAEKRINNLYYGEILFHLYQKKYFATLTDLLIAQKQHPIAYQGDDPAWLLSGLAVTYGLYGLADETLERLFEPDKPQATRDIAWFYNAKLKFLQGDLAGAERSLTRIKDTLPADRDGERLNLLVDVYRAQGRLDKAEDVLGDFSSKSPWRYYALYNTGVSLVRLGELGDGTDLLKKVSGQRQKNLDEELKSLTDRANLALGYGFFAKGRGNDAANYFKQVRLEGPFSNQALLGLGWAYAGAEKYQQALVPWFELKTRNAIDPTVQESLITIPHVIERMGKPTLAVSHYEQAIAKLEASLASLDNIILKTRSGSFLTVLRPQSVNSELDKPWQLSSLPDIDAAPYLMELLKTREFQEAFEDYRTLIFLEYVVKNWRDRLPAFMTAVQTRADSFDTTSQRVAQQNFDARATAIERRYAALRGHIDRIENTENAMALASVEENAVLEQLKELDRRVAKSAPSNTTDALRRQIAAMRGQIIWRVTRDYAVRRWSLRETFDTLGKDMGELQALRTNLGTVKQNAPAGFTGYDPRFSALNQRLEQIQPRLTDAIVKQETRLQTLALAELARRQKSLEQQVARARFSLVRLYDSLSAQEKAQVPAGTAAPPGPNSQQPAPPK